MASEQEVKKTVELLKGTGKTFAEFLAELFNNRCVEIYVGDSYEEISTEQISMSYPAILCGKVISAYRECLAINSLYVDQDKKIKDGKILFVNERSIKAITEVDENGVFEDCLLRSKESLNTLSYFRNKK